MNKELVSKSVSLGVMADKSVINSEFASSRIVEISVTPPEKKPEEERPPLNLSLVLDHSGSMSGEKLHYVKQAAAHVVELMEEKDRVSVVIYDDRVGTIVPIGNATEEFKREAKHNIQAIRSGNSTFLSGGWLRGCEQVAEGATQHSINRTLLLTDGLANVGIQDPEELAIHAREIFRRGVSTSCFGVGQGYDEHLLEGMSNNGGGNFHYLETMNAIPLIFEREFDELILVSLRDVELTLKLPEGVKSHVFAGWTHERSYGQLILSLGNLLSGKCQRVYLRLDFPKGITGETASIPITVRGKGDGEYICDAVQTITFKPVPAGEEKSTMADQSLMERFAEVDLADRANEALKMEKSGNRLCANSLMQTSIDEHNLNMSPEMKSKFQFLASEMSAGMNEESRKRHHLEEYENRRGRERMRYYTLKMVNGHLIAEIEGQEVLVDTGVPISIGKEKEFYFLNQAHPLSPEFMGVTLGTLEKMVGTHIGCVMGADILKKFFVTFDLPADRISFSDQLQIKPVGAIPLTDFMGSPIATCVIDGAEYQVFIDTGTKLSYISQKIAAKYTSIGKETDFYPGLGEFETQVFNIPLTLGDVQLELRCGVLPELLETTLRVTGKSGIIGTELFKKYRVRLALPNHALYLEKL